jgi:polypyrimidine tract-binding protein 2
MSSGGGGGQQFRYAQTPSKVLHLRNLPWECAEEELVELCKPFGRIVNTKSGVGVNRNQAFVEFVSPFPAPHSLRLDATPSISSAIRLGIQGGMRRWMFCVISYVAHEIDLVSS